MTGSSRWSSVALLVVGWIAGACGDYRHANPFDPATPLSLEIVGPDTVTALKRLDTYTLVSNPEFRHEDPLWGVVRADGGIYADVGNVGNGKSGNLEVWSDVGPDTGRLPLQPKTLTIEAVLGGGQRAQKTITLLQVPVALRLSRALFGDRVFNLDSLHTSVWICGTYLDRNGIPLDHAIVEAGRVVRDPTIVTLEAIPSSFDGETRAYSLDQVHAVKPGSTYIIYTALGLIDSVLVNVTSVAPSPTVRSDKP